MDQLKNYKYATVILAILVVILALVLIFKTAAPAPATNSVSDATQTLKTCNENIAAWRMKYASSSVSESSQTAQVELTNILSDCNASIH